MLLSQIKAVLETLTKVEFLLPDGTAVPAHFHVTEVGSISKHYIDCGGTERRETIISLQLWTAEDYDHRLSAVKLKEIIKLSEKALNLKDTSIEVEYQGDTIKKYAVEFNGTQFQLTPKQTDCLAKDNCGVPTAKPKVKLAQLKEQSCCDPTSGCC